MPRSNGRSTGDIGALVDPDRVHRRVYIDPDIFELEMDRIWDRAWIYVGHESQVKKPGDFFRTEIGRHPVILTRHDDGEVHVLFNRCAHKGAEVVRDRQGNARFFFCSYHGWTYRTDGSLEALPLPDGYDGTSMKLGDPEFGLKAVPRVASHRGFVFASLAADGPDLATFLGEAVNGLDNMCDRAPDGEVEAIGTCARTVQHSNWKFFLENQLDGVHAGITHQSGTDAGRAVAEAYLVGKRQPFILRALQAQSPPDPKSVWPKLNTANYPRGHSFMDAYQESRGDDPEVIEYEALMRERHGAVRAEKILSRDFHHTVVYPCLSIHSTFQQLRVVKPQAVDRTLMDIWHFRLKGAPKAYHRRHVMVSNNVNTPATVIGADDYENWFRCHQGLKAAAQDWVSIHRDYGNDEQRGDVVYSKMGTSEVFQRNQYAAWLDLYDDAGLTVSERRPPVPPGRPRRGGRSLMATHLSSGDIRALIEPDRVHKGVYIDPGLFELEMERLWGRAWIYVGHESQVPNTGDFFRTEIGPHPVIMVRHDDGKVHVLYNRCAHKGAEVVRARAGNVKFFYCSYHGWTYRTDGSLESLPLADGYNGTELKFGDPEYGLKPVAQVDSYRGFVFAKLSGGGPDLRSFLGEAADGFDDMVERAPDGELEAFGTCARTIQRSNWKFFFENQLDGVHAGITHQSSTDAAKEVAKARYGDNEEQTLAMRMLQAQAPPDPKSFWVELNQANFPNGHANFLGYQSARGTDPVTLEYEDLMRERHGEERAEKILSRNFHHTIIYPCLSIQGAFQQLRVIKPIAVDRTLMEIWHFRLKGAPAAFTRRNMTYSNIVNSPATIVSCDDYENWYRCHEGLKAQAQDWVSVHRDYGSDVEDGGIMRSTVGTSEVFQRRQYETWREYMTAA